MPLFELQGPDGKTYEVDAPDMNAAAAAFKSFADVKTKENYVQPAPPPGEVIHGSDGRSFISDQPEVSAARDPDASERDMAVAMTALKQRGQGADMGAAGRAMMPVFQGQSMNWGDEALSGIKGATDAAMGGSFQDSYDLSQAIQAQELERAKTENPTASLVGQIAGGVSMGGPLGRAVGPLLSRLPAMGAVPTAAGLGAGLGAAAGAGDQSGGGRGVNAAVGAGVGGVLGAATPFVARGVENVYNAVLDRGIRNNELAGIGVSPRTAQFLGRQMQADGTIGGVGEANIRAGGQNAMLVDAGPNLRTTLDTAIARGGDPRVAEAARAIEQRAGAASQQVDDALTAALGAPQGVQSTTTGIRTGSAQARSAAYDAAYGAPIDYADDAGRQIEQLLRRVPQAAISRANQLMAVEGNQSRQIMAQIADDGSITYTRMPDVRQLDYIKRALQDVASSGEGQGALGGQTDIGRAYAGLARELRDATAQAVPQYRTALQTAADPIGRIKALKFGSEALRSTTPRDVVAETVRGMTEPERQAVAQGIRSQIDEVLANVKRTVMDPNVDARQGIQAIKDLSSPAAREKIGLIVGPEQSGPLFAQLDEAARAFDLRAGVSANSRTYARTATDQMVKNTTEPGIVGRAMEGDVPSTLRGVVQALTSRTPDARLQAENSVYGELAQALTGSRGEEAIKVARALLDAMNKRTAGNASAQRLGATTAGQVSVGAYQGVAQALSDRRRQ